MKYRVITPLSRMHPAEGLQTFTTGDPIDIENKGEAARLIAAGIIAALGKGDRDIPVETADQRMDGVEKAIKGKKGG